jgi:thiamine monophosphate kinase
LVDGLEEHAYIRDRDLRELALHWGGEYELMAAVDPQGAGPLVQDLVHLGLEPAIVGTVTEGRKTIIIDDSGREVLRPHGFDHFQG